MNDGQFVESILLEGGDRPAEKTCADEENEVGHDDEENSEG